jgi:tetratricopeptide (TPR) repeat protein
VEAALAREAVWRYNEAIELYSRGMEIAQDDYRMYLGRAHRIIRLRRFESALDDLNRSVELDPYGFNSAYLRGLTLYLLGRFDEAAAEYGRCSMLASDSAALQLAESGQVPGDPRHCMVVNSDDRSLVAMTAWRYRALRRAGQHAEAQRLVAEIPTEVSLLDEGMQQYLDSTILPGTNEHYHNLILFYRGMIAESELLDRERWGEQWPTVAYGAAVWFLVEGDSTRSVDLLREIVSDPNWARFGHVAAEADLMALLDQH